jgi:hypothetical protein
LDKDTVWSIFEQTGDIDAYLLYNKLQNDTIMLGHQEAVQGANNNANKNRRSDNKGNKRR